MYNPLILILMLFFVLMTIKKNYIPSKRIKQENKLDEIVL